MIKRRQPANRPKRNWADSVVLTSYEGALTDAEQDFNPPPAPTKAAPKRTEVLPNWLVAGAAGLAGCALVASLLWWQQRSRVVVVTHQLSASHAAGADALGCPNLGRCELQFDAIQPIAAAARRLFPYAAVLNSVSVTEIDTNRTVRTAIVLSDPSGVEISATAQCIPGTGEVPDRTGALPPYGPAQADFVVAGRPGCSVAVSAEVPQSVPVPVAALQRLAEDPAVQLSP